MEAVRSQVPFGFEARAARITAPPPTRFAKMGNQPRPYCGGGLVL
jgi:hypothetical protein